jgi:hypothetical protein
MKSELDAHKYQITKAITELEQEVWLNQIDALITAIRSQENIKALAKPMRQKIDIQAIAKEQGYIHNPEAFEASMGAWNDVEESLELLAYVEGMLLI